ncbi:23S rRNA (uracil(1939)-C(5))-methyltransferase RlmD [Paracandidimonas soli]|uniref:23S rRNA (uracil(1939)-C(5))-methyltransferase RlmD n=1 Tax=Paracandidimonas soli TaxID=1917182 RepID=A0A4R3VDH8_9BURK|nr:23S rRNA (uracil(1939)-C(5))-methyltransferase RlmD [Paracandidimonas soli]TCV01649.1 23S rRNA (uracil1939-C5)-methyltransferase [Paracandidimonas soli]
MPPACVLHIDSLDIEGRGVARHDGKVFFVEGALPGELVRASVLQEKARYALARLDQVLKPSPQRRRAPCLYADTCGGCSMQHLEPSAQVATKQRVLEDTLRRIGGVKPEQILPPLHGPEWAYRHRARLAVRAAAGVVRIGYREQGSHRIADVQSCAVLPAHVSSLLPALHAMVASLSMPQSIREIGVAAGSAATALVLHHEHALSREDIALLREFAARHGILWWLQPPSRRELHPLNPGDRDALSYALPAFGLRMPYFPTDFTQANPGLNQVMVSKALQLLDARPTDRVADFFCGLGNFSLPLAIQARQVLGVEGSRALTERAMQAAQDNHLQEKVRFATTDLFAVDAHWLRRQKRFDRVLLDPPRDGAQALCLALAGLAPGEAPERIVYVSCNPATLARDAGILAKSYRLLAAGVINMFPHTGHVESLAVFERIYTGRP